VATLDTTEVGLLSFRLGGVLVAFYG